ncbi:MAG: F0F1 ATP synthase subunit B [Candidatus Magasanikbacteria bacterium]|nr:F0F1 ATP synthase subunit B [Candidatus Magasanikbacteria bacterium]
MNTVYASSEPIEAEVGAAQESGVAASLGLNGQLFAFQLLNFAIVAAIVWFLILKPLTKKLEERKNLIDESLDKTKQVDANLQMAEQKFQERIDGAKAEASKIVEKAFGEGERLTVEMKKRAQKEIELVVDQARRNIKIEKEEMIAGLKQETVNLIVAALEKILSEKVDGKKDKELIEETLKGLKN